VYVPVVMGRLNTTLPLKAAGRVSFPVNCRYRPLSPERTTIAVDFFLG